MESRTLQALDGVKKAVNLPAWEKLSFMRDADGSIHFLSGHKTGGNRLKNSILDGGKKDIFPEWMSEKQITNTVKEAYNNSKKVGKTQIRNNGDEVFILLGESKNGTKIKMYFNVTQKMLETVFPQ